MHFDAGKPEGGAEKKEKGCILIRKFSFHKKFLFTFILLFFLTVCLGCSHVIQQREPDQDKYGDLGSETQVQLRGPGAALIHKF